MILLHVWTYSVDISWWNDIDSIFTEYVESVKCVNNVYLAVEVLILSIPQRAPRQHRIHSQQNRKMNGVNQMFKSLAERDQHITFIDNDSALTAYGNLRCWTQCTSSRIELVLYLPYMSRNTLAYIVRGLKETQTWWTMYIWLKQNVIITAVTLSFEKWRV